MPGPTDTPPGLGGPPVARVLQGDPGGLLKLYADCGAAVYTLALHVTSSPAAAAEVTYEVFTDVWAGSDQGGLAAGPARTRLAALTHERATRTARRMSSAAARPAEGPPPADAARDAQQLAHSLVLAAQMGGAAADLDPQQRLALAVTYSAGRTIGDTARILGLSRSTVLRQLAAGVRRLLAAADPPPGSGTAGAPTDDEGEPLPRAGVAQR